MLFYTIGHSVNFREWRVKAKFILPVLRSLREFLAPIFFDVFRLLRFSIIIFKWLLYLVMFWSVCVLRATVRLSALTLKHTHTHRQHGPKKKKRDDYWRYVCCLAQFKWFLFLLKLVVGLLVALSLQKRSLGFLRIAFCSRISDDRFVDRNHDHLMFFFCSLSFLSVGMRNEFDVVDKMAMGVMT